MQCLDADSSQRQFQQNVPLVKVHLKQRQICFEDFSLVLEIHVGIPLDFDVLRSFRT